MDDIFASVTYEPLDDGLAQSFRRTLDGLSALRDDLAQALPNDEDGRCLWRWAMIYAIILKDIGESAFLLLHDGKHSRASTILRRIGFEYRTRFHFYRTNPAQAKAAMEDFERRAKQFARRLGPDDIRLILDPHFDESENAKTGKASWSFEQICDSVYGDLGQERYGRYYSYPSALLHGDATASIDVLELTANQHWLIHLDSRYPFTNTIAANFIVFLLDFALDAAQAFDLKSLQALRETGDAFNESRTRLGIEFS